VVSAYHPVSATRLVWVVVECAGSMRDTAMISIRRIELPVPGIELLRSEARDEGYNFIERLVKEWESSENRFDAPGEILCGHLDRGLLVAVGGLNRDPFAGCLDWGRIRRVYVRSEWRKKGIGRALVATLIEEARKNFTCVRLRVENPDAACLYEKMGFAPIASANSTHTLFFDEVRSIEL
jgi:GNAT superfamily N-acetyltransferase